MNPALFGSTARRPVVLARPPLPPLPPGAYDQVLPWTPPTTRDFMRANAWAVTIPGLPFLPGLTSSVHPERCLTWFLRYWSPAWQDRILATHAGDSYTHLWQSAPALGAVDPVDLASSIAACRRAKQVLPYVTLLLSSKVSQPRDQSVAQWKAYLDPLLDAYLSADVVDEFVPGWEWDLFNVPGPITVEVCKYVGQKVHAAGKSCWLHFSSEKTSWFAPDDSRGRYGFWADLGADVDGLLYQTIPSWSIGDVQARLVDTLIQFANQGLGHKLRLGEDQAAYQFDGNPIGAEHPNEDDGDLRGYLACCTAGPARVWGYAGGGRRRDGSPL